MGVPPKEIMGLAKRQAFMKRHALFFGILLDSGSVQEAAKWMGITPQAGWHLAKKAGYELKRVIMYKGEIVKPRMEVSDEPVQPRIVKPNRLHHRHVKHSVGSPVLCPDGERSKLSGLRS